MNEAYQTWDRVYHGAKMTAINVDYWIRMLEEHHDRIENDMEHEDDYQHGYLHGLRYAIDYLIERHEDSVTWSSEAFDQKERLGKGKDDQVNE